MAGGGRARARWQMHAGGGFSWSGTGGADSRKIGLGFNMGLQMHERILSKVVVALARWCVAVRSGLAHV